MAEKLGHKTERLSIISAWREGEIIAPMVFDGYCNSQLFCQWIESNLLPELLPGQIVIMDNASFHPVAKIKELFKSARCEVIFLPPYSPDLNKIEKFWARLKNYVSQILSQCQNLFMAVREAFLQLS